MLKLLRSDFEKEVGPYKLRKSIRDEKRAAEAAEAARPGYKPYVQLNHANAFTEHTPRKNEERRQERKQRHDALQLHTARRHASLVQQEFEGALVAARARTGDHWASGHWELPLPPSMRSLPKPSPRRQRQQQAAAAEGEERGPERESTLMLAPGSMYAEDTSKGRARRLAAQIAKMPANAFSTSEVIMWR